MGLVLEVASGLEGFGFSNDDFARFAATILKTASTDPQLSNPTDAHNICTVDLPVQKILFEPDSAESATVTVACQLGSIRLALSLDAYVFFESLKTFMERRRNITQAAAAGGLH